jgi:hypothetical protein
MIFQKKENENSGDSKMARKDIKAELKDTSALENRYSL